MLILGIQATDSVFMYISQRPYNKSSYHLSPYKVMIIINYTLCGVYYIPAAAAAAAKSLQSYPTLCDPIDGSPPGSPVPGILQARTLERVAIAFSNACMHAKLLQLCLTLCNPIDGSPPGSPIPGILQARILVGLPFPSPMHESEK